MKTIFVGLLFYSFSFSTIAGGNPEQVSLPKGYKTEYTHYETLNRQNGKQLAMFYANKAATDSATGSEVSAGSIIVMEIYKTITGEDGKPITDANGLFKKDKLAAIGVMEKRADWGPNLSASDRSGDWGFAIYKADGSVKENNLDCVGCHNPLAETDYLFSHSSLHTK